ncbi:inorganic diphosphatase [Hymenobacter coalescens]
MPPTLDQPPGCRRLHVVTKTSKSSPNKLAFAPALGFFRPKRFLSKGSSFSKDFGFVPSTLADDGNPVAVLLMDASTSPGTVAKAPWIGVLEVEQPESGQLRRHDRLLAVAAGSGQHRHAVGGLPPQLLHEIEPFLASCHEAKGQLSHFWCRSGKQRAEVLVQRAAQRAAS